MKIYVASSWKNDIQPVVVATLRAVGHEVYDFRHPASGTAGFQWSEVESAPRPWTAEMYRRALAHPRALEGFSLDMDSMRWCDVCVLVLPAGRSASFELGWCMGAGKKGIVFQPFAEEPELMYRQATIVGSVHALIAVLEGEARAAAWDKPKGGTDEPV